MEYLDHSLTEYIQSKTFQNASDYFNLISSLSVQMIDIIEKLHNIGYIHRDIKPDNFRVHKDKIYLTDFGTIQEYKKAGKHVGEAVASFIGTMSFAPIRAHKSMNQSRRDDLEALAYTILSVLCNYHGKSYLWFNDEDSISKLSQENYTDKKATFSDPQRVVNPIVKGIQEYLQ